MFPAIPELPRPLTVAHRVGFWIICGVTFIQVGYPILMAVTFGPNPVFKILIPALVAFALLAFPMHLGLIWARFLNVAASFLVGGFFLWVTLTALANLGDRLANSLPVFLMIPVLPGVAYTLCAILLLTPAAGLWQRWVIEQSQRRMRTGEPPPEPIDPNEPLVACTWCEAMVVRVADTHCRACNRPLA